MPHLHVTTMTMVIHEFGPQKSNNNTDVGGPRSIGIKVLIVKHKLGQKRRKLPPCLNPICRQSDSRSFLVADEVDNSGQKVET